MIQEENPEISTMSLEEYKQHYEWLHKNWTLVDNFSEGQAHWHRTRFYMKFIKQDDKILDLGCNNGGLVKYLVDTVKDCKITAVDVSESCISRAKVVAPSANYITSAVEELELPDEEFDIIIAGELLEHILVPKVAVDLIIKLLKPGGYLLITTPKEPCVVERRQHLRILGPKELTELLPGIVVDENDNIYSWLGYYNKP